MPELPPDIQARLLAYLDGKGSQAERAELQQLVATDPKAAQFVALQDRFDESIRRLYAPPAADPDFVRSLAVADVTQPASVAVSPPRPEGSRRLLLAVLATAASITVAFFSVQSFFAEPDVTIAYRQRPLVDVYAECVNDGFEPYWVCDDDALFAATFERRQGVRLKLAELPADQEMLGLAYLAGLSHDSTSMLATVNGERTLVVVDRIENDWRPETGEFANGGLRVSRWERFGLAFYQVAPPGVPLLTDAFELAPEKTATESSSEESNTGSDSQ